MFNDMMTRLDGWVNLLAGLGKRSDKTKHNDWGGYVLFDDSTLSNLYDGDGLASKIVDVVPDDMTRNGWKIKNDDEVIKKEMSRLGVRTAINKALKYARLYRGALIVIITKNGKLENPLNQTSGEIKSLRVYSAARIPLISTDIVDDPNSKYFEEIEVFPIYKRDGNIMKVHNSRCLIFKGEVSSDCQELDIKYRYWGLSTLQKIWQRLANYSAIERGISNLMLEFSVGKYKLSNLAQILSQGKSGVDMCYNRMEIINASKSIINAVLLGENEDYSRDTVSLNGIGDVVDRGMMNLSSVCGIPVTKLFGRSPAGMNATGESDIRNYYDDVSSKQEIILLPELQKIVNLVAGYVYPQIRQTEEGEPIEEYEVELNPLWEPTEKELAEIGKIEAETDNLNIMNQIYDSEEARKMRFPELENNTLI
jgi:phage-related protein (TIGR01555 family)